jgi:hypothetical protein
VLERAIRLDPAFVHRFAASWPFADARLGPRAEAALTACFRRDIWCLPRNSGAGGYLVRPLQPRLERTDDFVRRTVAY